jgi:hypothetical protein
MLINEEGRLLTASFVCGDGWAFYIRSIKRQTDDGHAGAQPGER